MLQKIIKTAAILALPLTLASVSNAGILNMMTFDFTEGFEGSYNGGPESGTGRLTFSVTYDTMTPDIESGFDDFGQFAIESITLSAPGLSLNNELVTSPMPLFIGTFADDQAGGITIFEPDSGQEFGWNNGPNPQTFMSDINDLSTINLLNPLSFNDPFFIFDSGIEFANGNTLVIEEGEGFTGTFNVQTLSAVPEPSTVIPLFAAGVGLLFLGQRSRKKA